MTLFRVLLCTAVCLFTVVSSQEGEKNCDRGNGGFIFYRMLVIKCTGDNPPHNVSREDVVGHWGSCINADERVRDMTRYFTTFGFDMSGLDKRNAFEYFETDDFKLETWATFGRARLAMSSFYDFAKFSNAVVPVAGWQLTTKRRVVGPKGPVAPGSTLSFSVMRVPMHGRYFCLKCQTRDFKPPYYPGQKHIALDMDMSSAEFGSGIGRGLYTILGPDKIDNRFVITFPADDE